MRSMRNATKMKATHLAIALGTLLGGSGVVVSIQLVGNPVAGADGVTTTTFDSSASSGSTGSGVVPVSAVTVTPSSVACQVGWACMWVDTSQGGGMGQMQSSNTWWGNFSQSGCTGTHAASDSNQTWNDCASSLVNGLLVTDTYYLNISYGGTSYALGAGGIQNQLSVTSSGNMNDGISSNYIP